MSARLLFPPATAGAVARLAAVGSLAALGACRREPPAPLAPGEVPMAGEPITIDGKLNEPAWNTRARIAVFTDGGVEARPYSQIRLLRDVKTLYVGLYAADQDIRSTDKFQLVIPPMVIWLDPLGHITPPVRGARAAASVDETIDDPRDEDEEWVVELAIPIASLPLEATLEPSWVHAARCDIPKDGKQRCGGWNGAVTFAAHATTAH